MKCQGPKNPLKPFGSTHILHPKTQVEGGADGPYSKRNLNPNRDEGATTLSIVIKSLLCLQRGPQHELSTNPRVEMRVDLVESCVTSDDGDGIIVIEEGKRGEF